MVGGTRARTHTAPTPSHHPATATATHPHTYTHAAINVRKTGKTPINLVVAKDVDKRVVAKGFQLENTWRLLKESKTGYDVKVCMAL